MGNKSSFVDKIYSFFGACNHEWITLYPEPLLRFRFRIRYPIGHIMWLFTDGTYKHYFYDYGDGEEDKEFSKQVPARVCVKCGECDNKEIREAREYIKKRDTAVKELNSKVELAERTYDERCRKGEE